MVPQVLQEYAPVSPRAHISCDCTCFLVLSPCIVFEIVLIVVCARERLHVCLCVAPLQFFLNLPRVMLNSDWFLFLTTLRFFEPIVWLKILWCLWISATLAFHHQLLFDLISTSFIFSQLSQQKFQLILFASCNNPWYTYCSISTRYDV